METTYDRVANFNEDEESEVILVIPYLQEDFKKWLMETRDIKEKTANDYLRAYESGYESLYEQFGLDLYSLLHAFIEDIPSKTGCDLTKSSAPDLVKAYLETMQEMLDKDEDAFTKAELCAMMAYHDFIVDITDSVEEKISKKKSKQLPDEEQFLDWLETEYKMDCENAKRIVSSIKRMDLIIPSLVTDPMSFFDVLRAIPDKNKRENYMAMVGQRKYQIFAKSHSKHKTIINGLGNLRYYLNFLNSRL